MMTVEALFYESDVDCVSHTQRETHDPRLTLSMSSSAPARVLVTGGAGYIGSHTCVELVHAGFAVTILDNLSNSSKEAVSRVRALVPHPDRVELQECCLLDAAALDKVLASRSFAAVIHFAALKVRE